MRFLLSLFALLALAAAACYADDAPPKYFLIDGKVTTERRVSDLEKQVRDLKAEVAALKAGRGTPAMLPAASVGACPNCTTCANGCTCFGGGYYCADGKCPLNAPAASQSGTLMTSSGRTIRWTGSGYVYADEPCVASPTCSGTNCVLPSQSFQSFPGFQGFAPQFRPGGNCRIR